MLSFREGLVVYFESWFDHQAAIEQAGAQDSVERVARLRRGYQAFSRGDFDEAVDLGLHPEFEYSGPGAAEPLRGADRFRDWMEPDAFESQFSEAISFEVSGDKVLIHQRGRNRGAASGIEMEIEAWTVWTVDDDGLMTGLEVFLAHEEPAARRAAGLAS